MGHGYEGEASNKKIADALGISEDDLDAYASVGINESDDGHPYSYVVTFDPSTPAEVREAAGAGDGYSVHVGLNVFEEEE